MIRKRKDRKVFYRFSDETVIVKIVVVVVVSGVMVDSHKDTRYKKCTRRSNKKDTVLWKVDYRYFLGVLREKEYLTKSYRHLYRLYLGELQKRWVGPIPNPKVR